MKYTFYDEKRCKREFELDKHNSIPGNSGNIYLIGDNICIKKYHNTGVNDRDSAIADIVAFKRLMKVDSKGFYKILGLLYDEKKYIMASESIYYPSSFDDVLLVPMDYFLDSLNNLYDATMKISGEKINMFDLHGNGNLVLHKDGIIIVDGDDYFIDTSRGLVKINKKKLYIALRELFSSSLFKYHSDEKRENLEKYNRLIELLFCFENNSSFIGGKVRKYKRPIDYLHSRINK